MTVVRGSVLPKPATAGTLIVLGDCDGVYWSDGTAWHPIERTNATGRFPMQLTIPKRPAGTRETILTAGPPNAADHVDIAYLDDDHVRFVFSSPHLPTLAIGTTLTPSRTAPPRPRSSTTRTWASSTFPSAAARCSDTRTGSRALRCELWRPKPGPMRYRLSFAKA